jgi:hypothetical protein
MIFLRHAADEIFRTLPLVVFLPSPLNQIG